MKKKLHEILGLSPSVISKWRNGKMELRPVYAKRLEQITGINRLKFLYPDEFGNPWVAVKELMKNKVDL